MRLVISKDDIPLETARQAHYGTSHTPEKRADQVQAGYVEYFKEIEAEFQKYEIGYQPYDAEMWAVVNAFKTIYTRRYIHVLTVKSRCLSPMITGPSNFPVRKARRANDREHKTTGDFLKWADKTLTRLRKDYDPRLLAACPIVAGEPDAIQRLEEKIKDAEAFQSLMKSANRIVRKKKLSDPEKIAGLIDLGISEGNAPLLLQPDFAGRCGFAPYQLTNNGASIRRMKKRMISIQAEEEKRAEPAEDIICTCEIGRITVHENIDENRLQISFEVKPPEQYRKWLKSYGFHWSGRWVAWQRQLTDNARRAGRHFFEAIENGEFQE
ncbi:MAG: hypothetical protein DRP56_08715 [Planctomycetota bacterium]|nr:MAG: hypothetical protein DRP56_08715 [Planctomycetota bacterium]